MIAYEYIAGDDGGAEAENAAKTKIQREWTAYRRFFNVYPRRVNFVQIFTDPTMQLLLNHFYDTEIKNQYKFDEVELTDSVTKNFFDDVVFNHLA